MIFSSFFISEEQIDIRKSEIVCQQISEQKLCGPYVVLIAHSHREYRLIILRKSFFVILSKLTHIRFFGFSLKRFTFSKYFAHFAVRTTLRELCLLITVKIRSHIPTNFKMHDETKTFGKSHFSYLITLVSQDTFYNFNKKGW